MKIILGSSSPRRKELFLNLGIPFEVKVSEKEESTEFSINPETTVMSLAHQKATEIKEKLETREVILITADTIVALENNLLGKPKSKEEAFDMLKSLSGREHRVLTGFCVWNLDTDEKLVEYVETKVEFKTLSDEMINNYIETKEPMDKAGAYGIQGYGSLLIKEIKGDYFNVVGLPISRLYEILKEKFDLKLSI